MDYYKMFDDFMKSYGYDFSEYRENNSNNNEESHPPGVADEECRCGDSDIPGGFQDLNPQVLIALASILGINIASELPFNLQNSVGNFLELLGQVIITFNSQQQYFQGGPGRYYNPIYRNSANPFCREASDESSKNTSPNNESRGKTTKSTQSNKELLQRIGNLESEIEKLKEEIKNLK